MRWGKEKVVVLACCLVAVAAALSFLVRDIPFLLASSLSFPFFVYSALSKAQRAIVLATKVSILLLSIAAGVFYPWYFAILILGFLGTRLYYRARFSLDYPTLT